MRRLRFDGVSDDEIPVDQVLPFSGLIQNAMRDRDQTVRVGHLALTVFLGLGTARFTELRAFRSSSSGGNQGDFTSATGLVL